MQQIACTIELVSRVWMQRATGGDEPVGEGRVHKDGKA